MTGWLCENWGSLTVGLVLTVMVAAIIRHLIRQKRSGQSCCGGCCGCEKKDRCQP